MIAMFTTSFQCLYREGEWKSGHFRKLFSRKLTDVMYKIKIAHLDTPTKGVLPNELFTDEKN
jgi:hypothetical protein